VKRRTAIKHIGAGLSASLILPWLSSCQEEKVVPKSAYKGKVAVIGGGAAGLYAADYLLAQGIDVVVYEASSRLGGRIRTLRPFDVAENGLWFNPNSKLSTDLPVELGADRILGSDSIWAKLAGLRNVVKVPVGGPEDTRFWLGNMLVDYETASLNPDFQQVQAFLEELPTLTSTSGTIQQSIDAKGISASMYPLLEGLIGNRYGTSNNRLATAGVANNLSLLTRDNDELLIGNNPQADVLIQGFIKASEKTQLNTVIKAINYQGEKVVLTGEQSGQAFTAEVDKVIVTVPVSVLKAGDIQFSPALPAAKLQAMNKVGMDTALRVILDFRKNFWGSGFRTIYGGETGPEYFNPGEGRSTVARTFHVTVSGSKAEELSALGIDVIPALLEELDEIYDDQASANVRTDAIDSQYIATIQDWSKEPFIKGSRSYLKTGGTNADREALAAPVSNLLYFAGEATDFSGDAGTINGALLSAERVAQEILESVE
jgi:monoamine oxidase